MRKAVKYILITSLCVILSSCGGSQPSATNTETVASETEIQKTDVFTPIEDFAYNLVDGSIELQKYTGNDETVYIGSQYEIDGTEYTLTKVTGAMFFGNKVKKVIFSEGIQEIEHAIFNTSKVEKVFFPSTMTCVYDDSLAYISRSLTDIYYGGAEDQWNEIYTAYETGSVSDSIKNNDFENAGAAAANKLNALIGHDFDISSVTMHYNASESELLN